MPPSARSGIKDAASLAERVLGRARTLRVDGVPAVTLSIGVAALAPGEDAAGWFKRADAALYAAKSAGRDRVAVAPPAASAPGPAAEPPAVEAGGRTDREGAGQP